MALGTICPTPFFDWPVGTGWDVDNYIQVSTKLTTKISNEWEEKINMSNYILILLFLHLSFSCFLLITPLFV